MKFCVLGVIQYEVKVFEMAIQILVATHSSFSWGSYCTSTWF